MASKVLLLSVVIVASFVLAQARPATSPSRSDAGVTAARPVVVDAGAPAAATGQSGGTPEVERLRKEVAELKLRTSELERTQAKTDALGDQLEKVNKQLADLKGQLTKLNDHEARRVDAEEAAQARKAATASAATSLNGVLGGLALGNTGGVDASLRYAESVYTGAAQHDVQLARAALAQGDLTSARAYLILALMEADAQR